MSDLVSEALRAALAESRERVPRFEMITFGGPGPVVDHEPAELALSLEDDDRGAVGR